MSELAAELLKCSHRPCGLAETWIVRRMLLISDSNISIDMIAGELLDQIPPARDIAVPDVLWRGKS